MQTLTHFGDIFGGNVIFFYVAHGQEARRADLSTTFFFNTFITQTYTLFMCIVFTCVMIFGGALVGFSMPRAFYLDYIPGFIVIQLLIAIKALSLGGGTAVNFWMILFPYSFHARVFKKRNSVKNQGG